MIWIYHVKPWLHWAILRKISRSFRQESRKRMLYSSRLAKVKLNTMNSDILNEI